jgi:hypothetical protein
MKIAKHRGMARARVARKLATFLHRMWADGAEFRFGSEKTAAAGASKMVAATALKKGRATKNLNPRERKASSSCGRWAR